ncbi:hypothetical protein SAMN05421797_10680 [Maribacter ulvicola]|uniref:Uncharacterized protein n=1 Tax=Maribacter ulvicola TaxID=228959 RepID=A0A1N6Y4Z6_9FLAO|nr:hypothetical protein SAMN05421797_10680 [Maribacter ulvicola]
MVSSSILECSATETQKCIGNLVVDEVSSCFEAHRKITTST